MRMRLSVSCCKYIFAIAVALIKAGIYVINNSKAKRAKETIMDSDLNSINNHKCKYDLRSERLLRESH